MQKLKQWRVKKTEPMLQFILSRKLGISSLMAQLLINRGIYTAETARDFLDASMLKLHHPLLMRNMSEAVEITFRALERGQKILVYGDYDVDGVTGTVLLVHLLRGLGGTVEYYIPHRVEEGYGLNTPALRKARQAGIDLVITVDCGISGAAEVEEARLAGGPEIIITDHHEPPDLLPAASAVINPKREDCAYPFRDLAGVGVAFKFGQALLERVGQTECLNEYLDLVCLGTIADIVSLKGENRILVRHGLPRLANSERPGLQALCQVAGIKADSLDTRAVGFMLAPRINAAGRLGNAGLAVELLLSSDQVKALEIAEGLNKENQERQKLETLVLSEALGILEGEPWLAEQKVLVLASPHWHPGVIGIVASRLVERFYKPVLLIACVGETGKGSARSVEGFHLYRALEYCSEVLTGYGGHEMAAGFSLPVGLINEFRDKINCYAEGNFSSVLQFPVLELDALISLQDVTRELVDEIERLAPHGQGNPNPLFGLSGVKLLNCRGVGKKNAHLKMRLGDRRAAIDGIGFNMGKFAEELAAGKEVNVAFTPSINSWLGRQTLQAQVRDLRDGGSDNGNEGGNVAGNDDYLRAAGELIFIPETVVSALRDVISGRGLSVPPEMQSCASFPAVAYGGSTPAPCPHTGSVYRDDLLAGLKMETGCSLMLVSCARHTLQLFKHVIDGTPRCAGEAAYMHGFMPSGMLTEILRGIIQGKTRLLVTTYGCLPGLESVAGSISQIFLAKPPVTETDWRLVHGLREVGKGAAAVTALYHGEDWDDNRRVLKEAAPERDMLALCYRLLGSQTRNGAGSFSKVDVTGLLHREGFEVSTWLSLAVAVAVFTDLKLLQYQWQEDMLKYKLLPTGPEKRELTESPTFVLVRKIKAEGLEWINRVQN